METIIHSDNDFATVAYVRIKNATLEPKDSTISPSVHVPPLLEPGFFEVHNAAKESEGSVTRPPDAHFDSSQFRFAPARGIMIKRLGRWVAISNVQRNTDVSAEITMEEEVEQCFRNLKGRCHRS